MDPPHIERDFKAMRKNRMSRFKIGDRIRILSLVATSFAGLEGDVFEVQPQPQNITNLDRYIVVFAWGEKQTFFDVQLEPVVPLSKTVKAA
jgi:hypothetical protein